MCGRCASTRDHHDVRLACSYRPRGSKKAVKPPWVSCSSQKCFPSYNISPQTNTPILLSSHHSHVQKVIGGTPEWEEGGERVLQTMKWGLIPSWHKGEPSSFPTLLNNCRCEGMLEKASFRNAVQRGQRCVVLADGFFEWKRGGGQKQPFFVYFADSAPTEESMEVMATEGEGTGASAEGVGKVGRWSVEREDGRVVMTGRMLTMAGLFDVWRGEPEEEPLYTYTVITVAAHSSFSVIHDRMPAILDGEEAIQAWLDPAHSTQEVTRLLQPTAVIKWHPVSSFVNNSRHKSPECITEIDLTKQVTSKQNTLFNWFSKSPKKQPGAAAEETPVGGGVQKALAGVKEEGDGDRNGVPGTKKPKLESEP